MSDGIKIVGALSFKCLSGSGRLGFFVNGQLPNLKGPGDETSLGDGQYVLRVWKFGKEPRVWDGSFVDFESGDEICVKVWHGNKAYDSSNTLSLDPYNYLNFTMQQKENTTTPFKVFVFGTLNSLLGGETEEKAVLKTGYTFYRLFANCKYLTEAQIHLSPEGKGGVTNNCCQEMFRDCSNLEIAKFSTVHPYTTAESCYAGMFMNCINLKSAPTLPAKNLSKWCYKGMFYNCQSLESAPNLISEAFNDYSWGCYSYMFQNCKNLKTITLKHKDKFDYIHFNDWVDRLPKTGKFYYSGRDDKNFGPSAIPEGWTVVKQ